MRGDERRPRPRGHRPLVDRVAGIEWLVMAAALALDLATYAGLRALRR
jgi:hypothetical protein